jgi:3-oxoacyl-[acyl-carrier protein] reductase
MGKETPEGEKGIAVTEDRVIVVTGSSRGIGATLVRRFADEGFRVVLNYAHADAEAEALCADLQRVQGDRVLKCKADVGKRAEVRRMLDLALERFGRLDVLVNNAGLNLDGPFLGMSDAQWDQVLATSLTGTFLCSQEFARRYRGSAGHIINFGAATAIRGRKNGANYCSAKAGVIALTKCLALELAPDICVNCIIPGTMETEEVMERHNLHDPITRERTIRTIPLGRLGTTDDVYRMVRFLVVDAQYITGQNFFVNGGLYI